MRPVLLVIAGPNGSGKTTVTVRLREERWSEGVEYFNHDDVSARSTASYPIGSHTLSPLSTGIPASSTSARRERPVSLSFAPSCGGHAGVAAKHREVGGLRRENPAMRVADGGGHREGPAIRAALGGGSGEVAATPREVGGFPGTDTAIQAGAGGGLRGSPAKHGSHGGHLDEVAANRPAFHPDPPLLSAKPGSFM